jgi:hypothetical protein
MKANQCTALIPRNPKYPPIHVLECDGPRYSRLTHPVQRGEGNYYLTTSNGPPCDEIISRSMWIESYRGKWKDWGTPCWDLYLYTDGRVEVTASRPTEDEAADGDLLGELGSIIRLCQRPGRLEIRNALRIARKLCNCDADDGIYVTRAEILGIAAIETVLNVTLIGP